MISNYKQLIAKVNDFKIDQNIDLSSGEDLSIGVMNLISIEEHLFYTSQKTKNKKYLEMLNEVRIMRTELMKELIPDYEGEVWCISKHLLSSSMRLMEVGTKELKKDNKEKAWKLFEKSYQLYTLFWGLNLSKNEKVKAKEDKPNDKSIFGKLGSIVQHAIDCCRE
ncbi:MAG TPA: hypothetical protein VL401_01810 [Alphaproteobacteria bacterium]|jgi:hypothetical protein|nr:hypothetical protein [Alphaproteobacteria bacterium]